MSADGERHEQALDDLIVAALRGVPHAGDLPDLEGPKPALSEADRRALDALGPGLVEGVIRRAAAPDGPAPRTKRKARPRRSELAGSLHRDDGEGAVDPEAREAIEHKIREIDAEGDGDE